MNKLWVYDQRRVLKTVMEQNIKGEGRASLLGRISLLLSNCMQTSWQQGTLCSPTHDKRTAHSSFRGLFPPSLPAAYHLRCRTSWCLNPPFIASKPRPFSSPAGPWVIENYPEMVGLGDPQLPSKEWKHFIQSKTITFRHITISCTH